MPLLPSALTTTPGLPGARGRDYPNSTAACAVEWARAVGEYARGVVPVVLPAVSTPAEHVLAVALLEAFILTNTSAADLVRDLVADRLEQAFRVYATTLGEGMKTAGYQAVPPPGLVGFRSLLAPPYPDTREEAVLKVAAKIDTWFRTGAATLLAPPYTTVPWS